ncbi:RNA recognition motif domain-containing protein [Legionella feeleii]|uniref:RNA binding protein, cold-inducible rrm n=1 Tax=Legionella feeleii TaxID=453 RepID=A0A0W0TUS3_9GAMM|nr:RNA-binding protein [Legionella feeleii]KTC99230.1 RNA binding protein, cold-inducible rrm [Legionella feeleii]SPX61085.1 RNA binding protein, cold-inducible rrm [Legionella feeleii]
MKFNKIYIGSLSTSTTEQDLKNMFSEFGSINEIKFITDMYTGISKGFAFITYTSSSSASKALIMNEKEFNDRTMRVSIARKKESGSQDRQGKW